MRGGSHKRQWHREHAQATLNAMITWKNSALAVTTAMVTLHCGASSNPQNAVPVVPTPAVTSPVAACVSTTKLDAAAQLTYLERIAQSSDLYARKDGHIVDAPGAQGHLRRIR